MKRFQFLIITIFILLVFSAKETQAINLNHPNDKYWHFGAMTVCSYAGANFFSLYEGQWVGEHPVLTSAIFCFGGGLAKEFLFDAKPDVKDIAANLAGIGTGALLTIPFDLGENRLIFQPLIEQKGLSVIFTPLNFNNSIIEINAARENIHFLLTFLF